MVLRTQHSALTANLTGPRRTEVGSLQSILSYLFPFVFFIVVKFTQDRIYCRF